MSMAEQSYIDPRGRSQAEIARENGVSRQAINDRIKRGVPVDNARSKKVKVPKSEQVTTKRRAEPVRNEAVEPARRFYLGIEIMQQIKDEAILLGFMIREDPNWSRMVKHAWEFYKANAGFAGTTLASLAVTEPKATREKMRAALTLADGNVSDAARRLDVSRGDFIRAVEALDMQAEIAKRWPKGAT
jgi:predicted DNA-binding protein YlxM (UPF0122 family)